jgi:acetolactate synthase-1/2/3 large subunit
MVLLTGGQIIYEYLKKEKVPYIVGIPGHGCLPLVDAFVGQDDVKPIMVKHEQSAAHLADGYYRVSGKPLGVFTSVGPGACNTISGVATAYVDSSAMLVFNGSVQTYMMGRGILQEIERKHWSDFWQVIDPVVKRSWQITRVDQLPRVLPQAYKLATTGRPGPVQLDLPVDIQAEAADVEIPDPVMHRARGRQRGDAGEIERAAKLLVSSRRPAIIAGGGSIISGASGELMELAEYIGAPVCTTFRGISKGVFPEDHPLYGFYPGHGSPIGNAITTKADVLLVVGSRMRDETTGSFIRGVSLNVPPTKVIHIDIDGAEIGKNVPTAIGIVGDARSILRDLVDAIKARSKRRSYKSAPYYKEIQTLRKSWEDELVEMQAVDPMCMSRILKEVRDFLRRDAIVLTSAGLPQEYTCQQFPMYLPRTYITSGGYSTMGFGIPAAIGAKLAAPNKQVLDIEGDGSFLQTGEEMTTARQYGIPIVVLVLNNYGWISIRDHQITQHGAGRELATEFIDSNGKLYSPNFVKLAEAYGCYRERITKPQDVRPVLKKAFESGKPAIIEAIVPRDYARSAGRKYGAWDLAPIPNYLRGRAPSGNA